MKHLAYAVFGAWLAVHSMPVRAEQLPDEPVARPAGVTRPATTPAAYRDALAVWKSPEDIAAFVDATFVYDRSRALALAESSRADGRRVDIHTPEALYVKPSGVCVDLSRFGVETLNRIDPSYAARYVMIEFEPVVIDGRTLRRHWVASFRRDGKLWVYADSRRPGHVAGPYHTIDAFIADYARYRGQTIVAWRETDSYLRRTRSVAGSAAAS